ncbi:RNA-directed DNA polymerase [Tanacetum coccineum]
MARNRHQVARTTRRVFGRNNYNRTLETAVDPERQLEISRERRANLVPAEVLYSNNRSTARHRVYEHYSEQRILCVGENQINLRLCNEESYESLRNSGLQHIHLGIFMIRLHALHRRSAGTNALVVLRDTRWEDSRQIIATMEVDLSAGTQLVYTFPDMILSVNDFHNHVEVAIQTHGYDTWQGESNLLITMALIGRSWERWSTLGEPSGKWDYYVKYDAPPDTTPIEEIAATGWGDEFSDDEVTPGKVTILEERSDWDDDERSGGKVLVIQERLAQNQQEFLDEYLPQWDEHLAIQKQELESEWENPFAAKRGENHTILHLSKEEENDDLPYPKFRNFKQVAAQIIKKHEEHAFPSTSQEESTQSYQPPHDSIMGPSVYPPAQQNPQPFYRPDYQFGYPRGKGKTFSGGYGEYYNSQWTLPPAWTESRVMLVLPADPGLWSEVISRWESITINRLNNQTWSDNKAKLAFVENLLGESEKLMWQQWRTVFPEAYSALEAIADEPQNITSQVRQLILLEDPYRGSTDEQDRAYRDLDRITCEETKICGVLPAIKFTHTFVSKMCKDAALAKELRDLSLCSAIPIPGYYKNNRNKYGMRKSRTYKGKPHNSHVKPFQKKYKDIETSKEVHMLKFALYSVEEVLQSPNAFQKNMKTICEEVMKISNNFLESSQKLSSHLKGVKISSYSSERHWGTVELPPLSKELLLLIPSFLLILTTDISRLNCPKCQLTTCALCARNYLGKTVNVKRKQPQKSEEEKDFSNNEVKLLKELLKEKTEQVQQMIRDQAKEYYENKAAMQKKEEIWQSKESLLVRDLTDALKIIDQLRIEKERLEEQKDEEIRKLKAQLQKKEEEAEAQFSREEFPPLGNTHVARPCIETEVHYSGNATASPKIRKITNQLYNVKVEFDIPNCTPFGTTAIIDKRASACCINKKVIPKEALEPLTQTVVLNGLNSRQQATHRIKQGYFLIEENKFKIPLIYAFDMRDNNGIEMLIGANFLRSMKGGIRIEGDEITIYKKVTKIKTSNQTEIAEIAELEVNEEEFLEINESIYFNQEGSRTFQEQFKPVIDRLKEQGYIGEEPLKH